MKMKKLAEDHYIICDDSEIEEGDWLYSFDSGLVVQTNKGAAVAINSKSLNGNGYARIIHGTQPLDCACSNIGYKLDTNCAERNRCFDKVQYLPLQEVKELIGVVDVEKKAYAFIKEIGGTREQRLAYIDGYNECLEDNKEKKYTRNEVHALMCKAFEQGLKKADVLEAGLESKETDVECAWILTRHDSTPKKTEWEVEFVDGKLKLKS